MKIRFERSNFHGLEISSSALNLYNNRYDRKNISEKKDFGRGLLKLGQEFTVYAVVMRGNFTKFYIQEPKYKSVTHFPGPCFDIVDNRVSRHWHIKRDFLRKREGRFPEGAVEVTTFAIKEWIEEARFLEFLVDEREREVSIMERMINLMDSEFDI